MELPGLARPGARAGTRVVARVGASSLLSLLPLSLAAVVGVHQPEVGQHLLEVEGVGRMMEMGGFRLVKKMRRMK